MLQSVGQDSTMLNPKYNSNSSRNIKYYMFLLGILLKNGQTSWQTLKEEL